MDRLHGHRGHFDMQPPSSMALSLIVSLFVLIDASCDEHSLSRLSADLEFSVVLFVVQHRDFVKLCVDSKLSPLESLLNKGTGFVINIFPIRLYLSTNCQSSAHVDKLPVIFGARRITLGVCNCDSIISSSSSIRLI